MTLINRYPLNHPLNPSQQSLLAAQVGPPQLHLNENTSVAGKLGSSEEPADLMTDVEDGPNGGIGE